MKELTELRNKVLYLRNTEELSVKGELILLHKLNALEAAINYTHCCTQLPTIIEVDFDGHLKCQIQTTDKAPTILKAVNGYGQPVDCNKDKIRINEI
jgi:hypothetical protein